MVRIVASSRSCINRPRVIGMEQQRDRHSLMLKYGSYSRHYALSIKPRPADTESGYVLTCTPGGGKAGRVQIPSLRRASTNDRYNSGANAAGYRILAQSSRNQRTTRLHNQTTAIQQDLRTIHAYHRRQRHQGANATSKRWRQRIRQPRK